MRLGVRLPTFKAAIVDAIKAAGDVGITSREIVNQLGRPRQPVVVKCHVFQINDLLGETDWRIVSDRRRWQLVKRRVRESYGAQKDLAGSIAEGFAAIRERRAAGGSGWEPA